MCRSVAAERRFSPDWYSCLLVFWMLVLVQCFFSLDIPLYSTYEILRSKLLFAIINCQAIDADFNPDADATSTWA